MYDKDNFYFEIFKQIRNSRNVYINDCEYYDDVFAEVYDANTDKLQDEINFYIDNRHSYNKSVLEIGCGTGRIMMQLAAFGLDVTGIDISKPMIDRLNMKLDEQSDDIKKLCKYEVTNIFDYETDKKFGMIIIPATTVCLLFDNFDNSLKLLNKIYSWLDLGGRLVFDYRIYMDSKSLNKSEPIFSSIINKNKCRMWVFQEFNNYIKGKSIVNYYLEDIEGEITTRYMCYSVKNILTPHMIDKLFAHTNFSINAMSTFNYFNNLSLVFTSYEK